jgi:hypothetical protein
MTRKIQALEVRIEDAWGDLTDRPVALYLLPFAGEWLIATNPKGASHIGTYTKAITLAQLRADVFETLEGLRA